MRHISVGLLVSVLLCTLTTPNQAQGPPNPVVVVSGDPAQPGGAAQRRTVSDSQGFLYTVTITTDTTGNHPLQVHVSIDGGQTWAVYLSQVNDSGSGLTGTQYANNAALAIDSQDRLHIQWLRSWYPSYFQTYYRWHHLPNGTNGSILDITNAPFTTSSTTSRTAALGIVVTQDDRVWMAAPSATSWRAQILRSNIPGAVDNLFTTVGVPSSSASAQSPRLAVDTLGNIHTTYYRNTSGAPQVHRMWDVAGQGWGPETILGDNSLPHDYRGELVADHLGNVHALVIKDANTSNGFSPEYLYRIWNPASGWSLPVTILDVIPPSWSPGTYQAAGIGCDEFTGTVFVAYRDFNAGGELRLAVKTLQDIAFRLMANLAPPSTMTNEYVRPHFRGSLHPITNNGAGLLDISWRQGAAAPFSALFTRRDGLNLAAVSGIGVGCTGSNGIADIQASLPAMGAPSSGFSLAGGQPSGTGYVFGALSQAAPAVTITTGCLLYIDPVSAAVLIASGASPLGPAALDALGGGTIPFAVPYSVGLAGVNLFVQGFMTDAAPPGFVLTQGLRLTLGF